MSGADPQGESSTGAVTHRLVLRARDGDRDAMTELYLRHHERVLRAAAIKLGRPLSRADSRVHDVAQEAWAQALDAILAGKFDPDRAPGAFRRWMSRLVANRVVDEARRRRRPDVGVGGDEDLDPPAPLTRGISTKVALRELHDSVESVLHSLNDRDREVLTMRHVCGMTSEEICAELGLQRPQQARWIVHRALERLRAALGRRADEWVDYFAG
ncbi:MAG: sigma-70 family RNA polymerase sigma factor [Planctomycetota bacterium]